MLIVTTLLFVAYCFLLIHKNNKARIAEDELLKLSKSLLSDHDYQNLREKSIWLGMPKCLIIYSTFGQPENVREDVNRQDHYETWYYQPREYQYRKELRYKYDFEIRIHNDFVIGWKP